MIVSPLALAYPFFIPHSLLLSPLGKLLIKALVGNKPAVNSPFGAENYVI